MPKEIQLTKGAIAIVDEEDFEELNQYSWHIDSDGYARRGVRVKGKVISVRMHHFLNKTPKGKQTDHINHNKLDNRKSNLRTVTHRENQLNRKGLQINNTSGATGVYKHKSTGKWTASIKKNNKNVYIGIFETFDEAVSARKGLEDEYRE